MDAARKLLKDMTFEHTVMTMLENQKTGLRTQIENRLIMMPHGNATPAEMLAVKNQMLDTWWAATQPQELLEQLARIYATLFTQPELESMAAFYRTDAGRRYVELTPTLSAQCGAVLAAHMQAGYPKLTQLLSDFQKAHPAPTPKPLTAPSAGVGPVSSPPATSAPAAKVPPVPPANIQTK